MDNRDQYSKSEIRTASYRTVVNIFIILLDTIPGIAIPATMIEILNIGTVAARKVGITLPSLTPNTKGSVFGVGIVGSVLDLITLELLPFPSSIFIHGAQILHDIRPIHKYLEQNKKFPALLPLTSVLNTLSYKILKNKENI